MFMLGYAYQLGALPLSAEAIEQAIELNGEAVAMNRRGVPLRAPRRGRSGRGRGADRSRAGGRRTIRCKLSQSFDETVERRVAFLTAYQNAALCARATRSGREGAQAAEAEKAPGQCGLAEAVARYLFKLMAYKDEYEVARLYSETSFLEHVKSTFDGDKLRFEFHLAPPLLARRNPETGEPKKMTFGPWMLKAFAMLAKFKFLRGTAFDTFGYTAERRMERRLVSEYEQLLGEIVERLTPDNHQVAVALATIPEKIRGFGPVKQRHLAAAKAEEAVLLEQFRAGAGAFLRAAE